MKRKSFFKAVYTFLSRPWVGIICGLILMIVPVCIAVPDAENMDPGFSYGVLYGMGFIICLDAFFESFASIRESTKKPSAISDRDLTESWMKSQCLINEKVLSILLDQWSDIPPVADPPEDDPRF